MDSGAALEHRNDEEQGGLNMDRFLPVTSKLGFGVGQIAEGIKVVIFNTFVLFYYNQILVCRPQ